MILDSNGFKSDLFVQILTRHRITSYNVCYTKLLRIGKSLGDDLAEGKPTLPLIRVLEAGTPQQADFVRRAIVSGGRDAFAGVLEAIQATGALDYAREAAHAQVIV